MSITSFIKKDKITELFKEQIDIEIKRRNSLFIKRIITPDNITECDRRLVYKLMGIESERDVPALDNQSQEFIKRQWVGFFSSMPTVQVEKEFSPMAEANCDLSGKVDAIIRMGDLRMVLLVCGLTAEKYADMIVHGAFRKDIVALNLYLWLSEISNGILLYSNKNTNDFDICHATIYHPIVEAARKKCLKLKEYQVKGVVPQRPYKKPENECTTCEFTKKCWKEEK